MKRGLRPARWLLLLTCLLAAVTAMLAARAPGFSAASRVKGDSNNPDKFHLIATNSSYDYSFTYDPLAADEWLFQGGCLVDPNLHLQ